jgi:hypothetical protein
MIFKPPKYEFLPSSSLKYENFEYPKNLSKSPIKYNEINII